MRERAPQKHIGLYFHVSKYICIHMDIQSMQFPFITYVCRYKRQYTDKTLTFRKIYEYASERSERALFFSRIFTFSHFTFLQYFVGYFRYFVSETYIFRSQITSAYIQSMQFPFIAYGMALCI